MVVEVTVFILAGYKGVLQLKNGTKSRLLQLLVRDSFAYFLV